MLMYVPKDDQDYIVLYGTAGWSSHFMASLENLDDRTLKALWARANKLLPNDIKKTHPGNARVSWLRIYKFTREYKDGDV